MNPYCKVYLDSALSKHAVLAHLADWVAGQVSMRTITANAFEVDVVANEDFDESRAQRAKDGFLFYRYYLDIEPRSGVPEEEYVEAVRRLLTKVRSGDMRAVASCDFEDQLPPPT
jgi:hypothetical protein